MKIREAHIEDYPRLVEFWNKNSGWDQIDMDVWKARFIDAPYGPSIIVIAEDNKEIISQLVYILLEVKLGNTTVLGCRPFAPIVKKSIRSLTGFVRLFNFGSRLLKEKGVDMLVMLPNPKWKSFRRFIDAMAFNFPLYRKSLDDDFDYNIEDSISVKYIDFDDTEIDHLWEEVDKQKVFMIKRHRKSLKWKNSHRDYKIVGVYLQNKLVGLATFIEKTQDKQIQICDLLYERDEIKEKVLSGISDFLFNIYHNDERFKKMVILVTESLKESLTNIGYIPDDYQFLFVLKKLNKDLSKRRIKYVQLVFSR